MSTSKSSDKPGTSTFADPPTRAWHRDGWIFLQFASGHQVHFPVKGNPRLEHASQKDLDAIELSPFGLHWPALDEDLSFAGILAGHYGQQPCQP